MPATERPAPLPGSRAGDAALATSVFLTALLEVVGALLVPASRLQGALAGAAGLTVGVLLAVAQAGTVLLRRRRPRLAYALLAVVAVASFASVGGFAIYSWPVLAFAVARAPGRAAVWLVLPVLGALAGVALLAAGPDLPTRVGFATGIGLTVGVLVLIGGAAGRYTRFGARRAEEQRRADEQARHAAALRTERARIADEIGSGVLAGLRRLVERTAAVGPDRVAPGSEPDLRGLREEAREVLAAMRRVLGVLRAPPPGTPPVDGPAGPPVHGPAGPTADGPPRWAWPLPDQAGLIALGAFLAVALPLAAIPRARTGELAVDRLLAGLELPLGSPVALLAVAVQFAAIGWWRTAPVPALLLSGAGSLVAALVAFPNLVADTGWMLLAWGAASRAPARVSGPAVLVSTLVVLAGSLHANTWAGPGDHATLALAYLAVVPFWLAGALVHRQRRQHEARHRERTDAGARDAVARERLRVARDLHDVVAHHVSAIAVQAGAARMAADPEARAEALAHIAASGRRVAAALPELEGLTPDPHGVVLDRDGVEHLVAPSRTAGLAVTVEVEGTPAAPPGDAELFAQRILTEALTNVLRHAGPVPARVRLAHHGAEVSLEVTDDGPAPGHRPDGHGSGLGLAGMRERAALLGGELRAGPVRPTGGAAEGSTDGAGWRVRAVLPRSPLVRADEPAVAPISSSAPIREDPPGS